MTSDGLLMGADDQATASVAEVMGLAFVAGIPGVARRLITDRSITNEALAAGVLRAHLLDTYKQALGI